MRVGRRGLTISTRPVQRTARVQTTAGGDQGLQRRRSPDRIQIDLDITQNVGALVWFDPASSDWGIWGYFFGGRLHLDEASLVDGAPVRGSFSSDVIEFGF